MAQTTSTEHGAVLLRADKLRLLVPQAEIGEIEHLDTLPTQSGLPGFLTVPGQDDVCYIVLAQDFTLLDTCPDDRFITTKIVTAEGITTQWCWSEARTLPDFALEIRKLPEVLLNAASPVRQYTLLDGQPVFVCTAQTLQHLLLGA